jgi:hypothetical protein
MPLCPICKSVAVSTPAEKFGDATFVCLNHEEFVVSHIVLGTRVDGCWRQPVEPRLVACKISGAASSNNNLRFLVHGCR